MVDRLVEMGYPEEVALIALERNDDDLEASIEYLLGHPEVQEEYVERQQREMVERVKNYGKREENKKDYNIPDKLLRKPKTLDIPEVEESDGGPLVPNLEKIQADSPILEDYTSGSEDDFGYDDYNDDFWPEDDEDYEDSMHVDVFDSDDIISAHNDDIRSVMDVCNVSYNIASALLRHYHFDKEKLTQAFFTNDPNVILEEAGIVDTRSRSIKRTKDGSCSVCMEKCPLVLCLSCSHNACEECWKNYLTVKIREKNVNRIDCFMYDCHILVPEDLMEEVVDKETLKKYEKFITDKFVEDSHDIVWCPSPACNNAVNTKNAVGTTVSCKCGHKFCFKCSEDAHSPCSCEELRKWKKKCEDESETYNWISVHAKECPKCKSYIEKDGGCNHMTCKKCKHEFCWVCMKDWKGHASFYECNRYKGKEVDGEDELVRNKSMLEKYLHYHTRYANHHDSLKKESNLREKAQSKMKLLQSSDANWVDVNFIMKGVEQLIECRSTLKWTYVSAYYLPEGKEKELFEFLQQELESTTEKLSGLLEGTITRESRIRIIDTTKLGKAKLENLLKGVETGLTNL